MGTTTPPEHLDPNLNAFFAFGRGPLRKPLEDSARPLLPPWAGGRWLFTGQPLSAGWGLQEFRGEAL